MNTTPDIDLEKLQPYIGQFFRNELKNGYYKNIGDLHALRENFMIERPRDQDENFRTLWFTTLEATTHCIAINIPSIANSLQEYPRHTGSGIVATKNGELELRSWNHKRLR